MRRLALVRRRDGETVPFEEARIAEVVHRALLAAGTSDRMIAAEIASVVSLFLEKTFYDEVPSVEQVEDMVEKVLIETGYAAAAKAFILDRERRARLREARRTRAPAAEPSLFEPGAVLVDDAALGHSAPYSRERVARTLALDGLLPRQVADQVAAEVEGRLRRAGVARAPLSLVRALCEAELLSREVVADLRRRSAAVIPAERLEEALFRAGASEAGPLPRRAAEELGRAALRCHSLSTLLPADVAAAHLDGEVHVHALSLPAALLSIALTPDDLKRSAVPGAGSRGTADAALTARRMAASLGRAARHVSDAAARGAAVNGVGPGLAPLLLDHARPEEVAEEAWHLLHECAADAPERRIELDLSPDVPDARADAAALDGAGRELALPNGEIASLATAFVAAVLKAQARGTGLPPREVLPVRCVGVSERALSGQASREVLRLAAEAVLRGERVVFPMLRDGQGVGGTSSARPPRRPGAPAAARACGGRITLNLPRAARRAGRGNLDGFLRECAELVELAVEGHRARRELLAQAAAASGGSLAPLFRAPRGRTSLLELGSTSWSVGLTGLTEALAVLTGFELHEGDEAVLRAARRVVAYLAVRAREAGLRADLDVTLDADEDPEVAARLLSADVRAGAARVREELPGAVTYTPGVAVRTDAPVDLLLRLEREEPLHASLATATLRLALPHAASGGPEGVVALLAKCLRAGSAHQVEVRTW